MFRYANVFQALIDNINFSTEDITYMYIKFMVKFLFDYVELDLACVGWFYQKQKQYKMN